VTRGPATNSLASFAVSFSGTMITITL
jgi:hypothetical protein